VSASAKIEAPQAPRRVGAGGGVPLPLGEGFGEDVPGREGS